MDRITPGSGRADTAHCCIRHSANELGARELPASRHVSWWGDSEVHRWRSSCQQFPITASMQYQPYSKGYDGTNKGDTLRERGKVQTGSTCGGRRLRTAGTE